MDNYDLYNIDLDAVLQEFEKRVIKPKVWNGDRIQKFKCKEIATKIIIMFIRMKTQKNPTEEHLRRIKMFTDNGFQQMELADLLEHI